MSTVPTLLSLHNTKTLKGEKYGYHTYILQLAPANVSGYNVCPKSSPGCRIACLNTAGKGVFPQVQDARIRRTHAFFEDRARFMAALVNEIELAIRRSQRMESVPCFRLNGYSDIRWENISCRMAGVKFQNVMSAFPTIQCGYPASSIRERIYADAEPERFGLLLYTGSSDAEGTLGGLVQQARHIEDHISHALRMTALCSNDPICAQHSPVQSMEERWLHGAACHGCALVAECSCEMRNDYLDRALVAPVIGLADAAFFQ